LDGLPWPDRGQIDLNDYQRQSFGMTSPTDVVITSRGCPFDCRFCSSQYIWDRRYLKRSVDSVMRELQYMKDVYGTRSVHFREDNLTVDKKRLWDLCSRLQSAGLDWTCQSRVNSLDLETVQVMKDAGCKLISCGFESVNDSTLQYVRKRQTARQVIDTIEIFELVGIPFTGAFLVATPNEGKREILNTIRFVEEVAKLPHSRTPAVVNRFVGIPISDLYLRIIEDGLVEYNWCDGELLFPRTYTLTSAEVDEFIRENSPASAASSECRTMSAEPGIHSIRMEQLLARQIQFVQEGDLESALHCSQQSESIAAGLETFLQEPQNAALRYRIGVEFKKLKQALSNCGIKRDLDIITAGDQIQCTAGTQERVN
jgi:radical SAM superfamily enzyme YgiQ (UPF0313 family)